jgi:long-subunit fatty acid transport protein
LLIGTHGYKLTGDSLTETHGYKSIGALAKVLPALSHKLTDRLSIGGTLGVGISHVELEGPYFLQGPSVFRGTPTLIDLQHTGAAPVWSVGLQYELDEATTLGLTYQSESRFRIRGGTRVEIPGLGASQYDSQLDITWPRSLGLGVRHELCAHRVVSCDVIYYNWSKAFDSFGLHLNSPSNPLFPSIEEQYPLDWNDSVSVRVGYERKFDSGLVWRLGYVHHSNPIPDRTLTPYIQATMEHSFSTGCGFNWREWDVDLAYMFMFGADRSVAASDFVGGDFDNARHHAQAHFMALSFIKSY